MVEFEILSVLRNFNKDLFIVKTDKKCLKALYQSISNRKGLKKKVICV